MGAIRFQTVVETKAIERCITIRTVETQVLYRIKSLNQSSEQLFTGTEPTGAALG